MLLDFLFPKKSLLGEEGEWITADELKGLAITPRVFSREELKQRGLSALDQVFAMSAYRHSPLLKKAIHTFKYRRILDLSNILQEELLRTLQSHFPLLQSAVLCPVPLHIFRRFQRGFNQAEILARYLSLKTSVPMHPLLRRIRPTGHQAWRGKEERFCAIEGAFRASSKHVPKHVYVVDDVFTTGATLEECARILKSAGAERVEGIVLAYD